MALGEPVGDGVASAFSASLTARPCEVAVAFGEGAPEGEVAFWSPEGLAAGLGDPLAPEEVLGDGLGVAPPLGSLARTGRKYSLAVVPTCCWASLELVPLGMLTMM